MIVLSRCIIYSYYLGNVSALITKVSVAVDVDKVKVHLT